MTVKKTYAFAGIAGSLQKRKFGKRLLVMKSLTPKLPKSVLGNLTLLPVAE
jgi:hypothetical protein